MFSVLSVCLMIKMYFLVVVGTILYKSGMSGQSKAHRGPYMDLLLVLIVLTTRMEYFWQEIIRIAMSLSFMISDQENSLKPLI